MIWINNTRKLLKMKNLLTFLMFKFLIVILGPGFVFAQTPSPHIITILIDDLGWNDVGFHGSDQIRTPNIDALAYSGMILNRHYVLPSCTPSRTALLTGRYPIRSGMQGFPLKGGENRSLHTKFTLQPEYLKRLGYHTHIVGKWHLGFETFNHVPPQRGFDSFFGYYNGNVEYYKFGYNQSVSDNTDEYFYGYDLHVNNDVFWTDSNNYATRLFTKRAENIIKNHDESSPLYLYLSHLATHTGGDTNGMEAPRDVDVNQNYGYIRDKERRNLAACLEELDTSIGVVFKALNEKNMLQNSIILVMSDNGAHTVSVDMLPNWGSNWPLSGMKLTMFEGGVRGAALIWSPFLPKGVINEGFFHIVDWIPTLYSAAGGNSAELKSLDGVDQWKALQKNVAVNRDNILVNIDDRTGAEGIIINNRWKVLKGGSPNYGYYDYHWGQENNIAENPRYDLNAIKNSQAGRIIRELNDFKSVFVDDRMWELRRKSTVSCVPPENNIPTENGFVKNSQNFRCKSFCVFDILNDPCELENIQDEEIINVAKQFLGDYKQNMIYQVPTKVELASNPVNFGGVWMPWDDESCLKSTAGHHSLNISIFIFLFLHSLARVVQFVL